MKRQAPDHRFIMSIPEGLPEIKADPERVGRILINILTNMVKFSQGGSRIKVSAEMRPERVVISVNAQRRDGPGGKRVQVFDGAQDIAGSLADREAGLGLLVCRRLVEAHRGEIWAENKPGQGTSFCFSLPLN
jgi:two-component system phosphate regulon sensor histidine kinase PhoR